MTRTERIAFFIVILGFAIGFLLYPQMPYWMVSHWDIEGKPNGYLHKFFGLFIIPIVSMGIFLLLQYLPRYQDSEALKKARPYYDDFLLVLMLFFFVLHLSTIFWNIGVRFMIGTVIALAFSVLFYYLSAVIEHTGQNHLLGIRTPWTMSDKRVWQGTHELAGSVYRAVSVVTFIGAFIPRYSFYFVIVPVLISTGYLVWYSYSEYRRLHSKRRP